MLTSASREHLLGAALLYVNPGQESQLARVFFQQASLETLTRGSQAADMLDHAFALSAPHRPDDGRAAEELTEADFDELIGLWER